MKSRGCSSGWRGSPDGDLPYALDDRKQPWTDFFRPSDQNLWALWLAAEYAAATGDLAAFAEPVGHHPRHETEPVPLGEHLRRQFEFLTTSVGLGEHGHLRILNADWNDLAMQAYPVSNLHSHAQPLLAYLRLLGIEPGTGGELRTGAGATFHSSVLTLNPDGSGLLRAKGAVTVRPSTGPAITGSGTVTW